MTQKTALGKGLASLLPAAGGAVAGGDPSTIFQSSIAPPPHPAQASTLPQASAAGRIPGISLVSLDEIKLNPFQPRRQFDDETVAELSKSIATNGLIQPLVVRKTSEGYQLIAGERRLRACKLAGLTQVPVVIRRSTDREMLEVALVENIQRENLNCVDEALAYFQLQQEFSLTQEEIAKQVGKDRATVANFLRLLKLPEEILGLLKSEKLSYGHGKAILGLDQMELQLRLAKMASEQELSVREVEQIASQWKAGMAEGQKESAEGSAASSGDPIQNRLHQLSQELTRKFSLKVEFKGSEKKGKIVFYYRSADDLNRVTELLGS